MKIYLVKEEHLNDLYRAPEIIYQKSNIDYQAKFDYLMNVVQNWVQKVMEEKNL